MLKDATNVNVNSIGNDFNIRSAAISDSGEDSKEKLHINGIAELTVETEESSMELEINKTSNLLKEYDFAQEDPKKMSVSEFSSRAIKSVICFTIFITLAIVGNHFLIQYGFVNGHQEYRIFMFIICGYQGLTILAFLYEIFGEIFCRCCFDKPYVQRNEGVSVLIAAYFPNEKSIIKETLLHMINNVECDRNVNVTLIYNTPKSICPEEVEILKFHEKIINGRNIFVIKNETSTSKAENLNYGIAYLSEKQELQSYTYIIDADHHPDFDCLQTLVQTIETNPKIDCVHGTTYIRNRSNSGYGILARLVDAEFFYFYNLLLPSIQFLTGDAYFAGSNGLWRTSSMGKFDNTMLTEDIDISIRSFMNHRKIISEYRARSGELIPEGFAAYYKQRLRWAIGWNEITYKYYASYFSVGFRNFSFFKFFGIVFLLTYRYIAFILFFFSAEFGLTGWWKLPEDKDLEITTIVLGAAYGFITLLLVSLRFPRSVKNLKASRCEIFDQFGCLLIYFAIVPIYIVWNSILEIIATVKIISRKKISWVVTTRATTTLTCPAEA